MKTALITGASSGIGAAFAKELATRQTNLILVARSEDKLEKLAQDLQSQDNNLKIEVLVQDLTAPQATQSVFTTIQEKGLAVDLLINNAGFGDYGPFHEGELARQVEMIQLNITALVELTYLFLPPMQKRGTGGIINVSSIAGFQPLPYLSVYAATKAFVLSFSEALWAENKHTGVSVLALCPGPTKSEFFKVAQFPKSFESKNPKSATVEEVVLEALKALDKNQSNVVTGGFANQFIANVGRFFPRDLLVSLVERQFKG